MGEGVNRVAGYYWVQRVNNADWDIAYYNKFGWMMICCVAAPNKGWRSVEDGKKEFKEIMGPIYPKIGDKNRDDIHKKERDDLKKELDLTNGLLEDQYRIMDAIPGCEAHGNRCISHAIEWINRVKTLGELVFKSKV